MEWMASLSIFISCCNHHQLDQTYVHHGSSAQSTSRRRGVQKFSDAFCIVTLQSNPAVSSKTTMTRIIFCPGHRESFRCALPVVTEARNPAGLGLAGRTPGRGGPRASYLSPGRCARARAGRPPADPAGCCSADYSTAFVLVPALHHIGLSLTPADAWHQLTNRSANHHELEPAASRDTHVLLRTARNNQRISVSSSLVSCYLGLGACPSDPGD